MLSPYKGIKVGGKKFDEHRLVVEREIGRKLTRYEVVHHKDGNKYNNSPDNLEVMSLSEHSRSHTKEILTYDEARRRGIKGIHSKSNLTGDDIRSIRRLKKEGLSPKDISWLYGISRRSVYDILNGVSWTHIE